MSFLRALCRELVPFLIIPLAAAGAAWAIPCLLLDWSFWPSLGLAGLLFWPLLVVLELLALVFLIPAALEGEHVTRMAGVGARMRHYRERYRHIPDGTGRRGQDGG